MSEIIVYSTPTCPWCKKAREYLSRRRVKFRAVDVTDDPKGQDEMMRKSGQMGVPVIEIAGKIIVGFDEGKLEVALKEALVQKAQEDELEAKTLKEETAKKTSLKRVLSYKKVVVKKKVQKAKANIKKKSSQSKRKK